MNKIFEIIRQAHHFRKILKLCKKISPDSEEYKLGKFYKDQIEEIEKIQETTMREEKINQLIQNVNENLNQYQYSKLMTEMLLSVKSFLTSLKEFV